MNGLPAIVCLSLAALFAVIGVVQLSGPRFLRDAYARWDYSQAVRVVTGVLDIVAASMLIDPGLRGWGIVLAAVLTFGSVDADVVERMPRDAAGYARRLYAALHAMDAAGCARVLVERPPQTAAWAAINDRLERAAR